jgi:hypothetical protein
VKELRQRLEGSSPQQQQQQASHAAAAATLQRNKSGSSGSRQPPASNTHGAAAAADSASTGSRQRLAASQQIASGPVGREDAVTWAAAVGRVHRTWPEFGPQQEAQLAKVRVSTRPNGERHDTSDCI